MSVFEFYIDAGLFNPNDEFGLDTLYLCSPIRKSFAFSYILDGKLLNYDHLHTARELKQLMSNRTCVTDHDCFFTDECTLKCIGGRCSEHLTRPQLILFCEFAKKYLFREIYEDRSVPIATLLDKCVNLQTLYSNISMYAREMSDAEARTAATSLKAYMDYAIEYSILTDEIRAALWEPIRLLPTPTRAKPRSPKPTKSRKEERQWKHEKGNE
jgi:hypothetical protein